MARMARVVIPGVPHHVTQRGNRRQKTFFSDADYLLYSKLIAKAARGSGTDIWAYCLMPNHVHFVMVPVVESGLRDTFAEAHRQYTRHVNVRNSWQGHLWQERFHSCPMDDGYLFSAIRYVERNPVAAGLCEHPQDWRWSSAKAHLSGRNDLLVNVQPMADRVSNWAEYLDMRPDDAEIDRISKNSRTGRPLGSDSFVSQLEALTGKKLRPAQRGPKLKN